MAEEKKADKTVTREVLVSGMYVAGTDYRRGDTIELTAEAAERNDEKGHTAEVGTLAKLAAERQALIDAAAKRAIEAERIADEEAARREALARDQLTPDAASTDGPRVETRSGSRSRR